MRTHIAMNGMLLLGVLALASCKKDEEEMMTPTPSTPTAGPAVDPATAARVAVDRFSPEAGTLMVRDGSNGLPAANTPINYDQAPFITEGLGPAGQMVSYYNFDVQSTTPAPIWVLFRSGDTDPVAGQLNIIDKIPGEAGYNDFWSVRKVTVPADYVTNSVTSYAEIVSLGYGIENTGILVNCPVVPEGSTAAMRLNGESNAIVQGWYKDKVVHYFSFMEHPLMGSAVPTSPIHVMFNINPDQSGGGPASGFVVEPGTMQTHNVVATVPADATYSPLWRVQVIDNADFSAVMNLSTAQAASNLAMNVANVNCPIVAIN